VGDPVKMFDDVFSFFAAGPVPRKKQLFPNFLQNPNAIGLFRFQPDLAQSFFLMGHSTKLAPRVEIL